MLLHFKQEGKGVQIVSFKLHRQLQSSSLSNSCVCVCVCVCVCLCVKGQRGFVPGWDTGNEDMNSSLFCQSSETMEVWCNQLL